MRDTDLDIAFCERYNLISDEYEGVSVTTLPFSVRVINRFIGNGITTVAELLKTSPSALMKLKGFGKNCLVEVDAFCATLNNDDSIPIVQNKKASLSTPDKSPIVISMHRTEPPPCSASSFPTSSTTLQANDNSCMPLIIMVHRLFYPSSCYGHLSHGNTGIVTRDGSRQIGL